MIFYMCKEWMRLLVYRRNVINGRCDFGIFKIFEADVDNMTIDQEEYIEEYGFFTFEEFGAICPVAEIISDAFSG